jgi:hypothetical protein
MATIDWLCPGCRKPECHGCAGPMFPEQGSPSTDAGLSDVDYSLLGHEPDGRLVVVDQQAIVQQVATLTAQVDLLTENMMKLQRALLLTNQKLAEFERRQSPIIGIGGEPIRRQ